LESLTLTLPQAVTTYQVQKIVFDWAGANIKVFVKDTQGDVVRVNYNGTQATNLMVALNKANLSTQSLHSRVLNQLATDGKLPSGTVTGIPD